MYCSSCGVAVAQGLIYCNYCGAKFGGGQTEDVSTELKPGLVVSAMVVVFVFGLVAITMLMGMMKAILHLEAGVILGFAVLCFLIMLSLEGIFMRLLFRRKHGTEEAGDRVWLKGHATNELDAAQLGALPEPVPSVTEHTTRAFDPVYSKRTSE